MGADPGVGYGAASPATAQASGRKRKHADYAADSRLSSKVTVTSQNNSSASVAYNSTPADTPKKMKIPKPKLAAGEEKRLRRFRPKPPKSFLEVYHRATTQRFYVLSRTRHDSSASCPEEIIELTGSTGNIYTVVVARQPTCTCPHAREGNQCKHMLYVLSRVHRARYDLIYQLALLEDEVREILEGAPAPGADGGGGDGGSGSGSGSGSGKRKPVEGDCPICFCELEGEAVVWCRAACGQNVHKGCFETWAATKRKQGAPALTARKQTSRLEPHFVPDGSGPPGFLCPCLLSKLFRCLHVFSRVGPGEIVKALHQSHDIESAAVGVLVPAILSA